MFLFYSKILYSVFSLNLEVITYLGANLVTALASLNVNDFSHFKTGFLQKKRGEKKRRKDSLRYEMRICRGKPEGDFFNGAANDARHSSALKMGRKQRDEIEEENARIFNGKT